MGSGEPYRIFFPLGSFIGLFAVSLWLFHGMAILQWHPGTVHSRLMIQGFLSCFVIGFLGTAMPRLLEVRKLGNWEVIVLLIGMAGVCGFHIMRWTAAGDLVFALVLGGFVLLMASRFADRADNPPPAFILVGGGLLAAILGSLYLAFAQRFPGIAGPDGIQFARFMLNHVYLLLPVLGIGAFLLPRFFGLPNRQNFPESCAISREWIGNACFALVCGLAIVGSFALENWGWPRTGGIVRALVITIYFLREVPFHKARFDGGSLVAVLRLSLWTFPAGYLCMALFPAYASAFLHVIFIGGFSLLTFVVATRVIWGHGGQSHRFRERSPMIVGFGGLMLAAMLVRVAAELVPSLYQPLYLSAASLWLASVALWTGAVLPYVRSLDDE